MWTDLDRYTIRARLRPPLLVALPLAASVAATSPEGASTGAAIWGLVTYCGGVFLLAQFGRDMGRAKQAALFAGWGGPPTTLRLRRSDAPNAVTLDRYHRRVRELLPEIAMPGPESERESPGRADEIYDSVAAWLRSQTRDRARFPLVFEENCNYGFRRNLWAMKPLGILSGVVGLLILGASCILRVHAGAPIFAPAVFSAAALDILFVAAWIFWIRPSWVRTAAEAYADRLLEGLDALDSSRGAGSAE